MPRDITPPEGLEVPIHPGMAMFPSKRPEVVVPRSLAYEMRDEIPLAELYRAIRAIEVPLLERLRQEKIMPWMDDLEQEPTEQREFAHLLEHAIIAVINNNMSRFQTAEGSVRYDIHLQLPPTIPGHLQEEYVRKAIMLIREQYKKEHSLDLAKIEL